MSIFYFSLALSIIFTLLVSSLRVIAGFPKLWHYLKIFKRFNVIPKLVIISQIFLYRFFGKFSRTHKIIYNIIFVFSGFFVIFSVFFRILVLKEGYIVMHPLLILLISFILCVNTIFRSFVSFSIIIDDSRLFTFLYLQRFFTKITEIPYWDNYVKELFERTKVSEKMEKDQNKNNKKT